MVRLLKRFGLAACVAGIAAAYGLFLPISLASVIMPVPFLWIGYHILRHEHSVFGLGRAREGCLPSFVGVTIPIIVLSPIPAVFLMTGVEGLKRAVENPSILAPLLLFVLIAGFFVILGRQKLRTDGYDAPRAEWAQNDYFDWVGPLTGSADVRNLARGRDINGFRWPE